jgi:hypothetical protein
MGLPTEKALERDHIVALSKSRAVLLEEIGSGRELTLVTGPGNIGDELIRAGTRALLGGLIYREIGVDELARADGDTALLIGGGGWCRPYHEIMPRALAVAELRRRGGHGARSARTHGRDGVRARVRVAPPDRGHVQRAARA